MIHSLFVLSDEEIVFRSWDGDIMKISTQSNETELLLKNTTFATFKASKFAVSPDLNYVLLGYDVKQDSAKGELKSHRPLHGVPQESAKGKLKSHRYTESIRSLPRVVWGLLQRKK
ncbi:Inactive dipeptidyl peptidase 10 [Liparis tanakae]|uniref:Inactive dipeptidyl peptidase 10 n=1 Tax=Liparis tanakae TaxID=230148 RepID=A0A4Z2GJB5_9TELE|nr:Inactive dipeptidyl peptidase 10 [Liparis tanakae]